MRTRYQGPDACVHLVSWGNIAKIVRVRVTVPLVCMEDSVWRRTGGPSPATVPQDFQDPSARLHWIRAIPTPASRGWPVTAQRAGTHVHAQKATMVMSA